MPLVFSGSGPPSWRPTASLEILQLRARLRHRIREWFHARGVLEVETPALCRFAATDAHIESLEVPGRGWLHTSPEFAMKRLLAAGSGDIYQFARVFRDGERGSRHNPEFTLLEWYRTGMDYRALMREVVELCRQAAAGVAGWGETREITYAEAMARVGVDHEHDDAAQLAACLRTAGVDVPEAVRGDRGALLDLVMSTRVEPGFDPRRPTIVYDFPPDQAALARIRPSSPPIAERFEVFLGGMELANGFGELTDAAEQRARFERDRARRSARGQRPVPMDESLLAALEHGLPACSGVALGFDRLVMAVAGMCDISGVLAFPAEHA